VEQSPLRLFARYALLSLIPVTALGVLLALDFRHEVERRGLSEGAAQAGLVAHAAVEPLLDGQPLQQGLTPAEDAALQRLVRYGIDRTGVLRLRVRGTDGLVVFSNDGSGRGTQPEDEVLDAAAGHPVTMLTHMNADAGDVGPAGVAAVEAYRPLYTGLSKQPIGVLEIYLPYSPIHHDVITGLHRLYRDLAIGLALVYLAGFAICATVSRGLRRQIALNAYVAGHDALTDLPNRTLFLRQVGEAMAKRRRVVVALMDLDRFKEINDTIGHRNGDRVLQALAARLATTVGDQGSVGRIGGDEFGLLLDAGGVDDALARVRTALDAEIDLDGLPVSLEASIGYVIAPDDGTDVDELVQHADVAMYVAKARQAGVLRYDAADDHYRADNLELIADFRRGVDNAELVLHYQPKATIADGRVEAVEALVRWNHPTRGLLYPDTFIPLVEPTELIERLTDTVIATAVRDAADIDGDVHVAVNVSARNLADPSFAGRVMGILGEARFPAHRLIVEITETALLHDPHGAAAVLRDLHDAGVHVSIDDFGKGQTSLAYLSALPVDELKIDRSFVAEMQRDRSAAAIVRSVVDLGHNLALRVVAEGVETEEILELLRAAGCDVAQGYLLARPMPADSLRAWLLARDGRCAPAATAPA
jgi:diguanylate cyclase (GGDEF)-like protein